MIRLLRALNARIQAWLDYQLVVDAPAGDLGSLDVHNGLGEVPPLTDAQASRLMRDILHPPFADWEDTRAEAEWDNHVDDALAVANDPWNDADRITARALGIAL